MRRRTLFAGLACLFAAPAAAAAPPRQVSMVLRIEGVAAVRAQLQSLAEGAEAAAVLAEDMAVLRAEAAEMRRAIAALRAEVSAEGRA